MHTIESLRRAAERQRAEAEEQFRTSEYPRHGRAVHVEHADALEAFAALLEQVGETAPAGDGFAERRARRVWRLQVRAGRKRVEAAEHACRSHAIGKHRPLGQPLVGSPSRQRSQLRTIERQNRASDRGMEAYQESRELTRRAAAAASNRAVSSDDPEALDKLRAKLARLEARREGLKAAKPKPLPILNYRAADGVEAVNPYHGTTYRLRQVETSSADYQRSKRCGNGGTSSVAPGAHRVRTMMVPASQGGGLACVFLTDKKAHPRPTDEQTPERAGEVPAYALTNLGAQIRSVRERIAQIEACEATPAPDGPVLVLPGCTVEDWGPERNRYALHSDDKPPREVTRELRGLGLRWMRSEGAWVAWRNSNGRRSIESGARLYSAWWAKAHAA